MWKCEKSYLDDFLEHKTPKCTQNGVCTRKLLSGVKVYLRGSQSSNMKKLSRILNNLVFFSKKNPWTSGREHILKFCQLHLEKNNNHRQKKKLMIYSLGQLYYSAKGKPSIWFPFNTMFCAILVFQDWLEVSLLPPPPQVRTI